MVRMLIYIVISIFVITLVRIFIGIIGKGLNDYLNPAPAGKERAQGKTQGTSAKGGTLRKDSLTGVYVAEEIAVTKVINGQTHYFASEENLREYLETRAV